MYNWPAITQPAGGTLMRLEPLNLYELEEHASKFISPHAWAFIDGGAQDEVTVKRNRAALEAITLRPRFMQDVSNRDLSTTVLGERISFPGDGGAGRRAPDGPPGGGTGHRAGRRSGRNADDPGYRLPLQHGTGGGGCQRPSVVPTLPSRPRDQRHAGQAGRAGGVQGNRAYHRHPHQQPY